MASLLFINNNCIFVHDISIKSSVISFAGGFKLMKVHQSKRLNEVKNAQFYDRKCFISFIIYLDILSDSIHKRSKALMCSTRAVSLILVMTIQFLVIGVFESCILLNVVGLASSKSFLNSDNQCNIMLLLFCCKCHYISCLYYMR